jgi:tRNA (guanine-N7-)-methyltransferase
VSPPEPIERARFFGRSKGKMLRKGQRELVDRLLPQLLITLPADNQVIEAVQSLNSVSARIGWHSPSLGDPAGLFHPKPAAVRLEIGFGGGEHLLHRARECPEVGFIGVEPFLNGMAKLLMEIEREDIRNIRVFNNDATMLLRRLPAGSMAEIDLLYADPWPKRRQRKRRFVSEESLALIAGALMTGGIFRFASDIDDYVGWLLARILPMPEFHWQASAAPDWTTPYPAWPGTRYEAKALQEGRIPTYLTFVRRRDAPRRHDR